MNFSTIPDKQTEKDRLIKQAQEDRIPHAQLFLGNEGSANLALALAFISYLFCENRTELDSCGQCANCKKTYKSETLHRIHRLHPMTCKHYF